MSNRVSIERLASSWRVMGECWVDSTIGNCPLRGMKLVNLAVVFLYHVMILSLIHI